MLWSHSAALLAVSALGGHPARISARAIRPRTLVHLPVCCKSSASRTYC
jgi:hypothetical protein